jgi:predicted lipoprotein with Yx(FWY)xxD motif
MNHRRNAIIGGAVALSSFFAVGAGAAVGAATPYTSGSTTHAASATQPSATQPSATQATVRTATTQVGAMTETILVNAKGLPLYYYQADKATKSQVSGALAQLWPAVVSTKPTASGVKGKVASVKQADGHQVTYNGHFLYTFVDDTPGHVTGQGVSDFFVATPNIRTIGSTTTVKAAPAAPASSGGYGY